MDLLITLPKALAGSFPSWTPAGSRNPRKDAEQHVCLSFPIFHLGIILPIKFTLLGFQEYQRNQQIQTHFEKRCVVLGKVASVKSSKTAPGGE